MARKRISNSSIRRLWLSRIERRTTLLPTRGRTHWRRGDDYMNDTILLVEEGKGISIAQSFLLDDALFGNSMEGIERWEKYAARYQKLKDKMDDEIKRAGLESLVPEELACTSPHL